MSIWSITWELEIPQIEGILDYFGSIFPLILTKYRCAKFLKETNEEIPSKISSISPRVADGLRLLFRHET